MTPARPRPSPPPPLPPVRRLTLADLPACLDLAADRGWTREEHKWRLLLTAGQGYGVDAPGGDPRGGLIGAYVLTSYGPRPASPNPRARTCVGMVLVAERHARRGLGRHLMRHALEESGDAVAFLTATPYGRPLYEELGFTPVGTTVMLTGRLAPTRSPEPPVPVRDATAADLPDVLALDARAFGADRAHLIVRLPSFADHFVVAVPPAGPGAPPAGRAPGGIAGFAAAWPNEGTTVIGPVVAEEENTARSLITELASRTDGPVRYDADLHHRGLVDWLRSGGLDGDFTTTVMVHGAPDVPGDLGLRFAPYSVALG
ncbi:GNAT family N-acetyltransferase [Streptomyces radiopugnans]|uniref:Ribosomal protein S18 acetylase RimI n=1 Tax=Streptomyces radiopugnans TaxID=403935 RepID=A0A1H9CFM6_9ACTN|nr:GNAT family N-acetyltransferase [Streptomyces radiopugnans]SEP99841.1 Ribosomal protein S18 acetylase RimI [Streptomyces radiopugnans]